MDQEKLIWELQKYVQEEHKLRRQENLKPLVAQLKGLQEGIRGMEEETEKVLAAIAVSERETSRLEKDVNRLSTQIKGNKDRLYGAKGGSLKELLSLQQSMVKLESELEKGESGYWDSARKTEELKERLKASKETVRELKNQYNNGVKEYKRLKSQVDLQIAEVMSKQEAVKGNLTTDTIRVYRETAKRFPLDPVAAVKGGSCSGCHITIPSLLSSQIREGKTMLRCDSCGRILISRY